MNRRGFLGLIAKGAILAAAAPLGVEAVTMIPGRYEPIENEAGVVADVRHLPWVLQADDVARLWTSHDNGVTWEHVYG